MKRNSTTLILIALLAALFFTSEACNNVPSMEMDEACHKACSSQPGLYELCRRTLDHAASPTEATIYAIVAAKCAKLAYESSIGTIDRLLQNPSLPGDEKAAYAHYEEKYAEARSNMVGVINEMFVCSFASAARHYVEASAALSSCRSKLAAFRFSLLYAVNLADQDKTKLAGYLGALFLGR